MNAYEVIINCFTSMSTLSLIKAVMKSYVTCPFEKYQLQKLVVSVDRSEETRRSGIPRPGISI